MRCRNPFGYRPGPVTFWTTAVYLALAISLIYVHETVPSPPKGHHLSQGLNLSEAWLDLQAITRSFHPFNSRQNEVVRDYLMDRSKQILNRNHIAYTTETAGGVVWGNEPWIQSHDKPRHPAKTAGSRAVGATIFDDQISNVTWTAGSLLRSAGGPSSWQGHYFEGNNFYVYIHGKEDPEGNWWRPEAGKDADAEAYRESGGVLVNCHFDSVSTGYGATDDGMSCVSMLQMMDYFTREGRQPRHGIVFLFNNAEEDGLLGARAFGYSPVLRFIRTFVNLEGAGGGGRALLFRATDLQTAKAYSKSPHPFGSVVAANAFERGAIKSGTDYEVFARDFGQRGLDIAFYAPRSRYHTTDDDTKHTSVNSIWHMLSAALASTERLVAMTSTTFSGDRSDGNQFLTQNGKATEGVWFDWYGSSWSAFSLRGLFAWSVTLLVTTPLALAAVTYLLVRQDRCYFLAKDVSLDAELDGEPVPMGGWRGFFRFPLAFGFAVLLTFASVLLVQKFNPLIVYSSSYAVWAMALSIFYFCFWLIMRGASFVRPSALHRGYALLWLFGLSWLFQVFAAYAEDQMHIGALYFAAFFHTSVFLALFISLLEQFALPEKQEFARMHRDDPPQEVARLGSPSNAAISPTTERENEPEAGDTAEEATETTPLRAGDAGYGSGLGDQPTFASTYRRSALLSDPSAILRGSNPPFEHEQAWSGRLPTWTWIVQFLLLAPVYLILAGSLSLLFMSSMNMTGADGGSLGLPSLGIGIMSILLLLPLTPFIHRVTHHIPLFLAAIFVGTLIYNLVAFPFSVTHRYKLYFQEIVDVDAGTDVVSIAGIEEFVRPVISSIPSAAGQSISCDDGTLRSGLSTCRYTVPSALRPRVPKVSNPADLIDVKMSRAADGKTASIKISAIDTRMCRLELSRPVYGFSVKDGTPLDQRFGSYPVDGLNRITLWRRSWDAPWEVNLQLKQDTTAQPLSGEETSLSDPEHKEAEELKMTVKCAYSDANDANLIPALHELKQYMPGWSVVTKADVGLVEVRKTYLLP
ncbi:putative zinc metalloprotease [Escovopsis weberi]|uniref:Peptide hydrolase n=1 Tax=Escovopsis weberi TaxID=150374 RepID=A0A0M8MRX9_ESCWE|nr:putative zinc metalloprotease [Escovopsis weberi]